MTATLAILKTLFLFTLTGLSLFRIAPRAIQEVHSWVDRLILSLLTGIAFYTIFFFLAMGLVKLPLTTVTVWGVFLGIIIIGGGFEIYRRKKSPKKEEKATIDEEVGDSKKSASLWKNIFIFLILLLVFFFSLQIRLQNGLKYPNRLLDADPYRHHIRTEALIETGYISKFDPYLVGEVPIFELQGCYILAGVIGVAGPFSAFKIWQWGAPVFGSLGVISIYLLAKLALQRILRRDMPVRAPPGGQAKGSKPLFGDVELVGTFLGIIAACLWAASPIQIIRTNAGFSEAFAIPLLAPTLLFYLWSAQNRVWGDFFWFGIFFSALAFNNPQPAAFLLPFLTLHALLELIRTRKLKWVLGIFFSASIFFACLLVWNWKFLAVPLQTTIEATRQAGSAGIQKLTSEAAGFQEKFSVAWKKFSTELYRNLRYLNLGNETLTSKIFRIFGLVPEKLNPAYHILSFIVGAIGSIWFLRDRQRKKWSFDETSSFFFLLFFTFLVLLLLVPLAGISFTDKYYRYILPLSLGFSISTAYFLWRIVVAFFSQEKRRVQALTVLTTLSLLIAIEGKTWGGWILNCTKGEYAAADWINQNTPADAILIANWYTGDYLRSLTKRRVVISHYPRVEVRLAKQKYPLDIPILPKDPQKVVDYVQEHPGDYYLVQSKWGPWGKYPENPGLVLMKDLGDPRKSGARIYQVRPPQESFD